MDVGSLRTALLLRADDLSLFGVARQADGAHVDHKMQL
jgi:hypothetical protein